ncbi:lysophospholipase [Actinoplanes bogorensis]|uniref:Lysophospholipase n=1 Tax=Paractinoplanes bogorensis TaxID=1610840 RepID=A0ABS5YMU0_9ACTN|nr:alpha/beta hydrolase [Actinoplanes bogorensis]MBU2664762.1 lysophospholipase [Actinoplanes bogorensis]
MTLTREWTYDGLAAKVWEGEEEPARIVLIAHGYGEHIGRYEHLAARLVADGAAVYAVDHVGHGRSKGERVLITDFEDVVGDLHGLDDIARHEHPGLPVVLLGHSMGGLIAARYAQRYGDSLAALVLSSPVVGRWDAVTQLLALDEIPDVPLDITTLSRDTRVGEKYAADPIVWHGPFKRPTLAALDRGIDAVAQGPSLGSLPLMWIHGEADPLVPIEGSRSGVEHLRGPDYLELTWPEARHELFNELNADAVMNEVVAFIGQKAAT